jgi:prepilin-type N-terminal cleavage/methylation domain-containing protein
VGEQRVRRRGETGQRIDQRRTTRAESRATADGFTLVELLVVVAIITLLTAILLPVARRARNQARAVVCSAHVKQWGTTLVLYVQENEGRLPRGDWDSAVLSLLRGLYTGPGVDPNKSARYRAVRTEGIALCPMTSKRNDDGPPFSVSESGEV